LATLLRSWPVTTRRIGGSFDALPMSIPYAEEGRRSLRS
jgi:hypothetical protein